MSGLISASRLCLSRLANRANVYSSKVSCAMHTVTQVSEVIVGSSQIAKIAAGIAQQQQHVRNARIIGNLGYTMLGVSSTASAVAGWSSILSGQAFWETNQDGSFVRRTAVAYSDKNNWTISSSIQSRTLRHPLSIATQLSFTASNTLLSTSFLHGQGLFDLGRHASLVGQKLPCSLLLVAQGLGVVQDSLEIHSLLNPKNSLSLISMTVADRAKWRQDQQISLRNKVCALWRYILEIAALPFDFGLVITANPVVNIFGSSLVIFNSILSLKDILA